MNNKEMNTTKDLNMKKGFTLLEMLLVIAIIAILAGIVIVAINPARQIAAANNAQRQSDTLAILNAVHQYGIDQRGVYTDLGIASTTDASTACTTTGSLICKEGAESGCIGTIYSELVAGAVMYIPEVPQDPSVTSATSSGYKIIQDSANGRFTVCAPLSENAVTISVTR